MLVRTPPGNKVLLNQYPWERDTFSFGKGRSSCNATVSTTL